MLDAGNPHALGFFPAVDLREVYHAVMSALLGWLYFQYPSQHPLSAAIFHQGQAIPLLRQRFSQGLHNDETYLILLCLLQTDARLLDNMHSSWISNKYRHFWAIKLPS